RMVFDLQLFGYDHAGEPRAARPVTLYGEGADFPLEPDFVRQDAVNMVAVQRGLASPGFGGARLSDLELRIRHWHSQYDRVMADVDDLRAAHIARAPLDGGSSRARDRRGQRDGPGRRHHLRGMRRLG